MADALSIYAATIGSVAAVGVLYNIFRDNPRLKMRLGREYFASSGSRAFALVSFDPDEWESLEKQYPETEWKAHLVITPQSRRPVTVTEAGVEFADRSHAAFKPGTTRNLREGDPLSFRVREEALGEAIMWGGPPTKLYATDGAGKTYRSNVDAKLRPWLSSLGMR